MHRYDPLVSPDPKTWLDLDGQARLDLVAESHRSEWARIPKPELHAIIHVIVENQIAEGDTLPTRRVLLRLMTEGLDRHDAVHAIGSVLAGHILELMAGSDQPTDPNAGYFAELEALTAKAWLSTR